MHILTIIIVGWTFFVSTNNVHIEPTKDFGHTSINCEAILQNDDDEILISEEITKLTIEYTLELNPVNALRNDKEAAAT